MSVEVLTIESAKVEIRYTNGTTYTLTLEPEPGGLPVTGDLSVENEIRVVPPEESGNWEWVVREPTGRRSAEVTLSGPVTAIDCTRTGQ